jgi:FtsH-binding integral membrane protein
MLPVFFSFIKSKTMSLVISWLFIAFFFGYMATKIAAFHAASDPKYYQPTGWEDEDQDY